MVAAQRVAARGPPKRLPLQKTTKIHPACEGKKSSGSPWRDEEFTSSSGSLPTGHEDLCGLPLLDDAIRDFQLAFTPQIDDPMRETISTRIVDVDLCEVWEQEDLGLALPVAASHSSAASSSLDIALERSITEAALAARPPMDPPLRLNGLGRRPTRVVSDSGVSSKWGEPEEVDRGDSWDPRKVRSSGVSPQNGGPRIGFGRLRPKLVRQPVSARRRRRHCARLWHEALAAAAPGGTPSGASRRHCAAPFAAMGVLHWDWDRGWYWHWSSAMIGTALVLHAYWRTTAPVLQSYSTGAALLLQ